MLISLLTHCTELSKPSNTGVLVTEALDNNSFVQCERIIWQRREPDPTLLARINKNSSALVYPEPQNSKAPALSSHSTIDHLVMIDATWQQARKIFNHSPYLHALPRLALTDVPPSRYRLRRNQVAGGLCACECAATLLKRYGFTAEAQRIEEKFLALIRQ